MQGGGGSRKGGVQRNLGEERGGWWGILGLGGFGLEEWFKMSLVLKW